MNGLLKWVCLLVLPFALMADDAGVSLEGKRAALIIAHRNFRDEELDIPRRALEAEGAEVVIVSTDTTEATGMLGMKVKPDVRIENLDPLEYDAILLVGGSGASVYFEDGRVHEMLRLAADSGRVVGAICIAPVTLAKAGLLKGRKATSFPSVVPELAACGAVPLESHVAVDGTIVTADGPASAQGFAEKVIELLREE